VERDVEKQLELQTGVIRDKTEVLLDRLLEARDAARRQARLIPSLTGPQNAAAADALERAIDSTRRILGRLNDVLEEDRARSG
jgi:hypothetical protein